MKAAQNYRKMSTTRLRRETQAFDQEMVVSKSTPLNAKEAGLWKTARRKPGRPRVGDGVRVVSVSVERSLLEESDALAKRMGITRAALIANGLRKLLTSHAA
ncbi:MAG: hypothetical protein ABIR28_14260 [Vicinamibacteria bacterium]